MGDLIGEMEGEKAAIDAEVNAKAPAIEAVAELAPSPPPDLLRDAAGCSRLPHSRALTPRCPKQSRSGF